MFALRLGSLLDLSIIANDYYITNAADILEIPNSTLAAYISGARSIKPAVVWDIGIRWSKYIYLYLSDILPEGEKNEIQTLLNRSYDWEDMAGVRHLAVIFDENFQAEYNLRQIVEPIKLQKAFGRCAAQVLARFEATQPASSKLDFSKDDAFNLLNILINGPFTTENYPNMLNLALRYVLWRVKTREFFKVEQFSPAPKCQEIRGTRPIPLLQHTNKPLLNPDHKPCYSIEIPNVPYLKKAATLDVLLLCRFVEVKVDHNKNSCYCSCTSYSNDFICFEAPPFTS